MKFKHLLSIVLTFVLCFGVLNFAFADEAAEVPEGYTPVYTAEDLNNIRNDLDEKYILMNDIDLSVYENWEPIGTADTPFTGELDGNGYSVEKLTIDTKCDGDKIYYFGLFGYVKSATIQNVTVNETNITIKYSETGKTNCRAGIISGYGYFATLKNCAVSGNVSVAGFPVKEIGGFVGRCTWSDLINCVNYTDINIVIDSNTTDVSTGGISGVSRYTTEKECANYGAISVSGNNVKTYSDIKIGGIEGSGSEDSSITDCYNRGELSVDFSNLRTYIGGLSGECNIVKNSYNAGAILYPEEFGGFAGAVTGNIFSLSLAVGASSTIENTYYNNENILIAYVDEEIPIDSTNSSFANVKFLNEEEMKACESFGEFDFDTVWTMEENGYPVLQNQPTITVSKVVEIENGKTYAIEFKEYEWNSTDKTVAIINEKGEITALSEGTATITVKYDYGYKAEYKVTVKEPVADPEPEPHSKCWLEDLCVVKLLKWAWILIKSFTNFILK